MIIMGTTCLLASIAGSFLPETLNENLPQNSAESKKFDKNRPYFSFANPINKNEQDDKDEQDECLKLNVDPSAPEKNGRDCESSMI